MDTKPHVSSSHDGSTSERVVTLLIFFNLWARDPIDEWEDYEVPDDLDARGRFNAGINNSEYVMSEEELSERNFASLKERSYKETTEYIGGGSEERESPAAFYRCPTWDMRSDQL
ncbi:hypothetical protein N7481_011307 [Penicillium waksmanii]|uniref:uncharacterized protein n=1 Tax=Penicillium waksmanii TaxID=69791 RepID=UPI00254701D0|nr:uncharacterized protein N7481_011307 [Penicillium waksmanii]KAJ5974097.1 hypothetical protein N7481_011307 [Penicillium waksmanii]